MNEPDVPKSQEGIETPTLLHVSDPIVQAATVAGTPAWDAVQHASDLREDTATKFEAAEQAVEVKEAANTGEESPGDEELSSTEAEYLKKSRSVVYRELQFPARSYIVQCAQFPGGPKQLSIFGPKVFAFTDLWWDTFTFALAVAASLTSLFVAAFRSATTALDGIEEGISAGAVLSAVMWLFSYVYPVSTALALFLRAMEVAATKEMYYTLIKRGIIFKL
jgi:hypothetical protein